MPTSGEFHLRPVESILVGERHRKNPGDIDSLADSISRQGLFHPIIIKRDGTLVAGGRRLRAFKSLKRDVIPIQYVDEIDEGELKGIELEENLKRADLSWQEESLAFLDFHEWSEQLSEDWTAVDSAAKIGVSERMFRARLEVAYALREGHTKIQGAESVQQAYNVLSRERDRAIDAEMMVFDEVESDDIDLDLGFGATDEPDGWIEGMSAPPSIKKKPDRRFDVLNEDFLQWLEYYDGPPFNFVHCDFPYGIGHHTSQQGSSSLHGAYDDSEETYWRLIDALIESKDKILTENAHIMFWFSLKHYETTRKIFQKTGFTVNPFPLIWAKSDGTGIVPDPKRGPRRVYETAFLLTKGDRPIVSVVNNVCWHPASKRSKRHLSEKPLEVLMHFFRMLVDSTTHMLDPTCGSGSSLGAAKIRSAARILGIEIDEESSELARYHINKGRISK